MRDKSIIIDKCTAYAFEIEKGTCFAVSEHEGPQIAGLVAFNKSDLGEYSSPGNTRLSLGMGALVRENSAGLFPYWIEKGEALLSNRWNRMLTIIEDTYGKHDIIFDPCDSFLNVTMLGQEEGYPGCREVHTEALEDWGVAYEDVPSGINLFQNTQYTDKGMMTLPSVSGKDDSVTFEVHMDLVISVSSCPCPLGERFPVRVDLLRQEN